MIILKIFFWHFQKGNGAVVFWVVRRFFLFGDYGQCCFLKLFMEIASVEHGVVDFEEVLT